MTQFADLNGEQQAKVVARAWQAIGLDPGTITDYLMAEWIAGLYPYSLEQIGRGVDRTKETGGTVPVNVFADFCATPALPVSVVLAPTSKDSPVAAREKARIKGILAGAEAETKEESYRLLGLHIRWGAL